MTNAMHDHNLDLILAIAEGRLTDAERAAAEAQVSACEECVVELAAQQLALEALGSASVPELTELEAVRMRRTVRAELGIAEPVQVAPRERSARWQRLSVGLSVAAILLLFVAVVPALDLFGSGDNDTSGGVALPAAVATSTATAEDATGVSTDDMTAEVAAAPTSTTAAPPTETGHVQSNGFARAGAFRFVGPPDLEAIKEASVRGYRETGDVTNLLGYDQDLDLVEVDDRIEICEASGLAAYASGIEAVGLGSAQIADDEVFLVVYIDTATGDLEIVAHSAGDCEIVASSD